MLVQNTSGQLLLSVTVTRKGLFSNTYFCIGWFNSLASDITILGDLAWEQSIILSCFMWKWMCLQLEILSHRINSLRFAIDV